MSTTTTRPPGRPLLTPPARTDDHAGQPEARNRCTRRTRPHPRRRAPDASLARVAASLTAALTQHGITGIYTATTEKFALISVAADLTAWTNGHQIWCTQAGQRLTWAAADIEAAATRLAALARPAEGS